MCMLSFSSFQRLCWLSGYFLFLCSTDFQNLSAKISSKTLDGAEVTLEQIEQTDSILVENLHPGTTPDMLTLYFESNRGGSQMVQEVIMLSEDTAKVSFVSYECKFFFFHHTAFETLLFCCYSFPKQQSLYLFQQHWTLS